MMSELGVVEASCMLETPQAGELLELLPNGIVVINAHGIIVKINQSASELLGCHLINRPWIEVIQQAFAPREDDGHEISLKDGRRVNISIRSLESTPGELIILTDLTTTRKFEQAKSQQQRLAEMGKMTAHLAHQIRTPLASAMIYTDHLINQQLPDNKKTQFIQQIKHCHNNIEQQIRDLLLFAGGGNSIAEQIPVDALIGKISHQVQPLLNQVKVKLHINLPTRDYILTVHIESLIGALVNLIDNAVKAQATDIYFDASIINQSSVELSVKDNGCGIENDKLKTIMQPFYTTRAKGTGLGLAVVQAVAIDHGGNIHVLSQLGQGSCFTMTLPLVKQSARGNQ